MTIYTTIYMKIYMTTYEKMYEIWNIYVYIARYGIRRTTYISQDMEYAVWRLCLKIWNTPYNVHISTSQHMYETWNTPYIRIYLKICVRAYMPWRKWDLYARTCLGEHRTCVCVCVNVCVYIYACMYTCIYIYRERERARAWEYEAQARRWGKKNRKKGGKVSSPAIFTAVIPDRTAQARCSAAQTPTR